MKNILIFLSVFLIFSACLTTTKNVQVTTDSRSESHKDTYTHIHKIAEALPLTQQEAWEFFGNLDSIKMKSFRNSQSQQFQYKTYTVFYEQPGKGKKLKGVGIDLDTTSHIHMEQLGKQLNAKWHSAELIEVKAGKIYYTADYIDSKKIRKKIHIIINLNNKQVEQKNEIAFIGIDLEPEKKVLK